MEATEQDLAPSSQRRDGLYFNEELFMQQLVYEENGIRRIAIGENRGKEAEPILHELGLIVSVDQIIREMNDVAPAGAYRAKRRFDIGENLLALCFEVSRADKLALHIGCRLSGKKNQFRCPHPAHLTIGSNRMVQVFRIGHLDVDHVTPRCFLQL
jgi:hypothetical protein